MKEEDRDRIESLIELYGYRHEVEEVNLETVFLSHLYHKNESSKDVKEYRSNQMGTFVIDAQLLLDLYYDEETSCSDPKFKGSTPQYYYLSDEQLLNYLTFRWKIKKGVKPNNNHSNFLTLYLMEIINGLYGNDFKTKKTLLDATLSLYPKGVKLRNIIKEAYEILYIQYNDFLSIEEYKSCVDLPILVDFSFLPFEQNLEDGKRMIPSFEDIFKMVKVKKKLYLTDTEEYLIISSYLYLYKMVNDQIVMNNYDSLDDMTACTLKLTSNGVFNKLKTTFTMSNICTFILKPDNVEDIVFGNHYSFEMKYTARQQYDILLFFNYQLNSIKFWCGDNSSSDYPSRIKLDSENYNEQVEIDDAIQQWVLKIPLFRNSLKCSAEELIQRLNQATFKLNIDDVGKVRKDSHEIQNKLIIEDETDEFPIQKNNNLKIKDTAVDDTIGGLCNCLNMLQKMVLLLLLEDGVIAVEVLLAKEKKMLSPMIDEINELSTGIIGDVIIIDYQVAEDYKEELLKELSQYK